MRFSLLASLLVALFCVQNVEAGFSNSGTMQVKNLNLSVGGTLDNNGQLIGSESANLSCDILSGKGLIKSPKIKIKTKIFAYTGTIECEGKCTIITATPFSEKLFKRKGGGEFVIIFEPNLANPFNWQASRDFGDYKIVDDELCEVEVQ